MTADFGLPNIPKGADDLLAGRGEILGERNTCLATTDDEVTTVFHEKILPALLAT
jgi:hypothetical protein